MERVDPANATKSLVNEFDEFIAKLNPDDDKGNMGSFASVLKESNKKTVKITELRNTEVVEGATVAIPYDAVEEVISRFANTLYGYFIGKRLAFPLVENYVKNTWAKFGLKRVMLDDSFFLFQFETKEGMESVIKNGPWLIRLVPLFLNVWTPNIVLKKEEIRNAPVWVKLRHVPIVANSEEGLSLITMQLGKPIMLDSYTSNMCLRSWGRKEYARALIEVSSDKELMESIIISIPKSDWKGHTLATIDIDLCPKRPKDVEPVKGNNDDGFTKVKRKKNKPKQPRQVDGVRLTKPALNLHYRRVERGESFKAQQPNNQKVVKATNLIADKDITNGASVSDVHQATDVSPSRLKEPVVALANSFASLANDDAAEWGDEATWTNAQQALNVINESDTEEMEELVLEDSNGKRLVGTPNEGASTPDVGWNHNDVDIVVLNQDDQAIHTRVWLKLERKELFCDFNDALFLEDVAVGASSIDIAMREFKECVEEIEVMDVQRSGLQFTWTQKPKGKDGALKKIDRIMANLGFSDVFVGAHAVFKPYRVSDHVPFVLFIPTLSKTKPKPFKFYNILTGNDRFREVVTEGWSNQFSGFLMFKVVQKLKCLKKPFRKLLYEKGNLHTNVVRLRDELDNVQTRLDADPFNSCLREEEARVVVEFNEALIMQERSRIDIVTSVNGTIFENEKVVDAFVAHYSQFLEQAGITEKVKDDLFSMGNDKAPGPDGYTTAFFKEAWGIVADDVTNAVMEFFTNGKLLRELNHTIIALILKVSAPTKVTDYRPISCCNVLFKCISKTIANHIKESLKALVS
ncbi:hypothetical protein Tco_1466256 [Tanacetum coccineum]